GIAIASAAPIVSAVAIIRARRRGKRTPRAALRGLVAGLTILLGVGLAEATSAALMAWTHRLPRLPDRPPEGAPDGDPIDILVLGESSALGVPYHPRLSMGKILAWQLER